MNNIFKKFIKYLIVAETPQLPVPAGDVAVSTVCSSPGAWAGGTGAARGRYSDHRGPVP